MSNRMVAIFHNIKFKLSPQNRIIKQINNNKNTLSEIREMFTTYFHHLFCFFNMSSKILEITGEKL